MTMSDGVNFDPCGCTEDDDCRCYDRLCDGPHTFAKTDVAGLECSECGGPADEACSGHNCYAARCAKCAGRGLTADEIMVAVRALRAEPNEYDAGKMLLDLLGAEWRKGHEGAERVWRAGMERMQSAIVGAASERAVSTGERTAAVAGSVGRRS